MKNSIRVILIAFTALMLWYCTDQQPENATPQRVQFNVHTSAPSKSSTSRVASAYLPAGTELLVSIEKSNGESVLDHQRVDLLKIGEGYVSGPVTLTPGSYSVTDFMLVLGDSVLYLTPQAGSPMAGEVANPLPYSFTVSADAILTLHAEVIRAEGTSAAEFGYTTFNIGIHPADGPSFQIAPFAAGDNGVTLTEADAYILDGLDTLDHLALAPRNNTWSFTLDTTDTYTLVVARHGSMRYSRTFTYTDLKEELDGKPLKVTLTPAVTIKAIQRSTSQQDRTFAASLFCGPDEEKFGRMYVNYGDNTGVQDYLIGGKFYPGNFQHEYAQGGTYFISIDGNLEMFLSFGTITDLSEMDASALHDVTSLGAGGYFGPSLRYLKLSRIAPIRDLYMPYTSFTSAGISAVIDDLHAAVVHNNTHGGSFDYTDVATPSAAAQAQLEDLQNNYGWTITH